VTGERDERSERERVQRVASETARTLFSLFLSLSLSLLPNGSRSIRREEEKTRDTETLVVSLSFYLPFESERLHPLALHR